MEFFLILVVIAVVIACERDRNYCGPPKRKQPRRVCAPIANKRVRRYLRSDMEFLTYYLDCQREMQRAREAVADLLPRKGDRFHEEYTLRMHSAPSRLMLAKLLTYLDIHHPETEGA